MTALLVLVVHRRWLDTGMVFSFRAAAVSINLLQVTGHEANWWIWLKLLNDPDWKKWSLRFLVWYWSDIESRKVGSCDFWMVSWCMVDLRCKVPLWPQVAASFCEAWSIGLGWQYVFRSGLNWYASVFDCWTQICCHLISSACMVCVIVMSVFGCIWFFNNVWTRCFCWTHWFALIWLSEFNLLVMWFTTDMLWWFCDWIPLQLRFGSLS